MDLKLSYVAGRTLEVQSEVTLGEKKFQLHLLHLIVPQQNTGDSGSLSRMLNLTSHLTLVKGESGVLFFQQLFHAET